MLAAAPEAGHAMQAATSNAAREAVGVGLTKGPAGCLPQHQQPPQEHSEGDHKTSGDCGAVFDGGAGKLEATVVSNLVHTGAFGSNANVVVRSLVHAAREARHMLEPFFRF
jgi:hypothetical protein